MTPILAAAFLCLQPGALDGDTWICADGTRVRAWGIQAAESHHPNGPAATRALSQIITGKTLTCQAKGRSYQRIVARCFTPDGRDVAAEMVRAGHAVDWPVFSGGLYR
jgi:micrococcal nuclease